MQKGTSARTVDPAHRRLQQAFATALQANSDVVEVLVEEGFVDIKVRYTNDEIDLIEVKSTTSAREAIREAIGQLLEYQYVAQLRGERVRGLRIAAPARTSQYDVEYLEHLRRTGLALDYVELPAIEAGDRQRG